MYDQILIHPDPRLRTVCKPVDAEFVRSGRLFYLIAAMKRHLARSHEGIGLAANQVGGDRRVLVIGLGRGEEYTMVNPVILRARGRRKCIEHCLSVRFAGRLMPARVVRPKTLRVQFDEFCHDGKVLTRTINASGLLAQCISHEVDHLNGITIIERAQLEGAAA